MDSEETFEDRVFETIIVPASEEAEFVAPEREEPPVLTTSDLIAIFKLQQAGFTADDFK